MLLKTKIPRMLSIKDKRSGLSNKDIVNSCFSVLDYAVSLKELRHLVIVRR